MPASGSGTGTPITGAGPKVAHELPYTHLSLTRYAQIMGIDPLHFAGGSSASFHPTRGSCKQVWFRHDWQAGDKVSHESLTYAILSAEQDIERYLGWPLAPTWIVDDSYRYPRTFLRSQPLTEYRNRYKPVVLKQGRFLAPGRRAVSLIGTVAPIYTDEDGDGFKETATITVASSLTDTSEIKIYVPGTGGRRSWEIRPVLSKQATGAVVTIRLRSWQLLDPDIMSRAPTDAGIEPVDLSDTSVLLQAVDVYREYTDSSATSARFEWVDGDCTGPGCEARTQDGCIAGFDDRLGVVVPVPAVYDDGAWRVRAWEGPGEPDNVRLWYAAGSVSPEFKAGESLDPLADELAQAVAWMATARLERPLCGCSNVEALSKHLMTDISTSSAGESRFSPERLLMNPFGSLRGEVMAWRKVHNLMARTKRAGFAAV